MSLPHGNPVRERQDSGVLDGITRHHLERYAFAAARAEERILDAACGTGYGSRVLLDGGRGPVTGVDIEPEALALARRHYPGPNYTMADVTDLPFADASFGTVVSLETLEHLEEPEAALAEFRRVLAPQGLLIASVPNENVYPFDPARFAKQKYPHHRHYTNFGFLALLNMAGFCVSSRWGQIDKKDCRVRPAVEGMFLVYCARRLP